MKEREKKKERKKERQSVWERKRDIYNYDMKRCAKNWRKETRQFFFQVMTLYRAIGVRFWFFFLFWIFYTNWNWKKDFGVGGHSVFKLREGLFFVLLSNSHVKSSLHIFHLIYFLTFMNTDYTALCNCFIFAWFLS